MKKLNKAEKSTLDRSVAPRTEEDVYYKVGDVIVHPVIITEKMWKTDPKGVELRLRGRLELRRVFKLFKNEKHEIRIVTDKKPPEGLKELAERYGVKIDINKKLVKEINVFKIRSFNTRDVSQINK